LQKHWKELGLGKCITTENLDCCQTLFHDLEQYDEEAVRPPTKDELEDDTEAGPEPKASHQDKNLINEEFGRLGEIKEGQKRTEKDLEFRE